MYTSRSEGASVFDVLRDEIPLEQLLQANGHRKIRCISPSHEDKDPSMQVYDDHVHCFGCLFHGDVVTVWSAMKGIERPIEAALDLAREFNVRLPEISPEAANKSEERREKEEGSYAAVEKFHTMMEEKKKYARVRKWWEERGFGPELRERFLLGALGPTEASIPFWHRGRVKGIINRHLEGKPKYFLPKAEEFVDGHRPLFIPGDLGGDEVFLVEGYVDALSVAACGAGKAVAAVGGTGASEAQLASLKRFGKIYILPDRDNEGGVAATTWAKALYPAARICPADYGEGHKDIADLFAEKTAEQVTEHLARLVSASRDILDIEMEAAAEIEDRRERLAYTSENIAPLLAPLHPEGLRDATADIVAETTRLKKNWITRAIKDHRDAMFREELQQATLEAKAEIERRREEYRARVAEVQPEIDALLAPGVLGRLRDTAAGMHQVYGDREALELALLVALGAQLDPLPNGRPLGASILLTAAAGRGKNHIVDAAVRPLPEEFYFAFEIASGQSLYYKADEDPDFLKHTFAYPNEIEGAEALWEFLRPMLSKGRATKIVTAKDAGGNMTTRTIIVEGPVTIAIPTIRNKTDEQLQTRLLVAELPDYVGRVKHHSAAVSEQLLPGAATADYSRERWLWQEALRSLTDLRKVVFPLSHPDFAFDDDQISHGARLWANLLSLMATSAWLEQKNRRILDLGEDALAVEVTPEDYEVSYRMFNRVCKRTVVNLSDTHRSILNGLYELMESNPERDGFRQREIAEAGGVSLGAISNHKTFLVMSAKLIRESEDGLALVEGADPSWWETGEIMQGLPTPAQVRAWWEERDPDPQKGGEQHEHVNTGADEDQNPHTYAGSSVHAPDEHDVNTFMTTQPAREQDEHVHDLFTEEMNAANGVGKGNTPGEEGPVHVFTPFTGSGGDHRERGGDLLDDEEEL